MDDQTKVRALVMMCQGFLDAIKEAGRDVGVPGGLLYAAIMDKISLAQFEQIMGALVSLGKVRRQGDLYFFVADM
jgi:hypothetical protein